MDGSYNPSAPAQLAYIVVTDVPPLEGPEHGTYRYTQASLKAALMCMGCKPRLAHKVNHTLPLSNGAMHSVECAICPAIWLMSNITLHSAERPVLPCTLLNALFLPALC